MTLRWLRRKGVWLFVAATMWYLAAVFLNEQWAQYGAKASGNPLNLTINTQGAASLSLTKNAACEFGCRLELVLDDAATAITVTSAGDGIVVNDTMQGDALALEIAGVTSRRMNQANSVQMHIPPAIQRIELTQIRNLTLSGKRSQGAALELLVKGTASGIRIKDIEIDQLRLACENPTTEPPAGEQPELRIEETSRIRELDVRMNYGKLLYLEEVPPEKIRLYLGKRAEITAKAPFLSHALPIESLP